MKKIMLLGLLLSYSLGNVLGMEIELPEEEEEYEYTPLITNDSSNTSKRQAKIDRRIARYKNPKKASVDDTYTLNNSSLFGDENTETSTSSSINQETWSKISSAISEREESSFEEVLQPLMTNSDALITLFSVPDDRGLTLLDLAINNDAQFVVEILFKQLSSDQILQLLSKTNQFGQTPVFRAITQNNNFIQAIFSNIPDDTKINLLIQKDSQNNTLLDMANELNNTKAADILKKIYRDILVKEESNESNIKDLIQSLNGNDLNDLLFLKDGNKNTILHILAQKGNNQQIDSLLTNISETLKELLIKQQNSSGNTPLHLVAENLKHKNIAATILRYYPKNKKELLKIKNKRSNNTPLHLCAQSKNHQAITEIMDSIEDPIDLLSIKNNDGNIPLHLALEGSNATSDGNLLLLEKKIINTIKALLSSVKSQNKVKLLTMKNNNGDTAISMAAVDGNTDILEALFSNITQKDKITLLSTITEIMATTNSTYLENLKEELEWAKKSFFEKTRLTTSKKLSPFMEKMKVWTKNSKEALARKKAAITSAVNSSITASGQAALSTIDAVGAGASAIKRGVVATGTSIAAAPGVATKALKRTAHASLKNLAAALDEETASTKTQVEPPAIPTAPDAPTAETAKTNQEWLMAIQAARIKKEEMAAKKAQEELVAKEEQARLEKIQAEEKAKIEAENEISHNLFQAITNSSTVTTDGKIITNNGEIQKIENMLDKAQTQDALNSIIKKTDTSGRTLLHAAADNKTSDAMKILCKYISKESKLNLLSAQDAIGQTPLHLAVDGKNTEIVATLVEHLTPEDKTRLIGIEDNYGQTPRGFAGKNNEIAALLGL
jgi:hypothetical protein